MATNTLNVYQRLMAVQSEAKAPREISGRFGMARSAEQILEAYKPVCNKHGLYLQTTDIVQQVGERNYVTTTARVVNVDNTSECVESDASAWENGLSNGLDTSQVTGKTSSYAKKYALQNLFAIDDTKDADQVHDETPAQADEPQEPSEDILARAKAKINEELEAKGYDTPGKKKTLIVEILGQLTIDNLDQADLVMDALEQENK